MAQEKYTVDVTNGSQSVKVAGQNVAAFIRAAQVFMVQGEYVPYFVATDGVWDGTDTTFGLTGAYAGPSATGVTGVIVTGKTATREIPTLSQGDVGTAAIFTLSMLRIEELLDAMPDEVFVDKDSDALPEGNANLYFSAQRVREAILDGLAAQNAVVAPSDTLLTAIGKLQGQHSAHVGARGDIHGQATPFEAGFMSNLDKMKLDGLPPPTVSATPPDSPTSGQRWVNTVTGVTFTWITSGASGAWVQAL